jgi:hypothetical protein
MAIKYAGFAEYWRVVGPGLDAYLAQNRNNDVKNAVLHTFGWFSFRQHRLVEDITKHSDIFDKIGTLIVVAQDALRALLPSQDHLSPVACATMTRIILAGCGKSQFRIDSEAEV